ncbi:MAG TPA: aminotransferase class V-fold PLP-dependent enzyme [Dermatophilaceae bacterium]
MSISTISRQGHRPFRDEHPTPPSWSPAPSRDHLRAVPNPASRAFLTPPRTVSENLGVPTLHRTVVDYANFDHAASTPALQSVKDAVDISLRTYSSVHRGNGYASRITSGWYEQARAQVHDFVGARPQDLVVFTRNSTDSLNLLARSLPARTTTFVFESEHHAALLPWNPARTVRIPVPGSVQDALVLLEDALRSTAAATTGPRLVVIAGASNVTGELWPIESVVSIARRYGARVALDAAQLAPHKEINIEALGVDYVAFSGHKLYAPFGAGVLAGRADWLNEAAPYLRGGGATEKVTSTGTLWTQGPARHEAGSPNVIGAIAIAAACAAIATHRLAIQEHEDALAGQLRAGLAAINGVTTYSIFGPEHDRVAVTCFTIDGLDSALVSAVLSAEYGIGVRDGKFCAHLLVEALLDVSPGDDAPTTAIRASIGLANTTEHVTRLLGAIAALAQQGPTFEYELTSTGWTATNDPRDLTLPRPW